MGHFYLYKAGVDIVERIVSGRWKPEKKGKYAPPERGLLLVSISLNYAGDIQYLHEPAPFITESSML